MNDMFLITDADGIRVLVVVILTIASISIIRKDNFNIMTIYKIITVFIILNLLLTILGPNYSLFNWLSFEEIQDNKTSMEYWTMRGQIGDFLAGHFTALAFMGLLISITQMQKGLQKQDKAIEIQKEEMILQRKELHNTSKALELQVKLTEKQNFEGTFFQLINLYNDVVNNSEYIEYLEKSKLKYNGKKAIENLFYSFLKKLNDGDISSKKYISKDYFLKQLFEFSNNNHIHLSHYFRIVYRILKFIDNYKDEYNQINKNFYANLLRAQLSSPEIALLFCNGLSNSGIKFKLLMEKYKFLEHLSDMKFFEQWDIEIVQMYNKNTFGNGLLSSEEIQKVAFNTEHTHKT